MSIKESLIISVSSVSGSGGSAKSAYSSSDKKHKDSDSTEEGLKVNICNRTIVLYYCIVNYFLEWKRN